MEEANETDEEWNEESSEQKCHCKNFLVCCYTVIRRYRMYCKTYPLLYKAYKMMFKLHLVVALALAVMAATDPSVAQSGSETREFDDIATTVEALSPAPVEEFVTEDGQIFVNVNMLPYEYRCWMKRVSLDDHCASGTRKSWFNERCEKCRCRPRNYVTCCTAVQKPIDYPSGCVPLLNKTKCKVVLRSKSNLHMTCRRNFHPSVFRRLKSKRQRNSKKASRDSRRQQN